MCTTRLLLLFAALLAEAGSAQETRDIKVTPRTNPPAVTVFNTSDASAANQALEAASRMFNLIANTLDSDRGMQGVLLGKLR
jgi:hypothetical protein